DEAQLQKHLQALQYFAGECRQLLPATARSPDFLDRFGREAVRFLQYEAVIKRFLCSNSTLIALCHWNANIDNAWFWRDASEELHCGLFDWGRVGQLNLAGVLWNCLFPAPLKIWNENLDELIELFSKEVKRHGGPSVDVSELCLH